ncbi:MAG TPA: hypothetical protein VJ842_04330 [Pyrinomonadaceae bacterium]|nr:hypothetical protein [Pyrinomonadaceae bacterium]
MKMILRAALFALFLLTVTSTQHVNAQTAADGSFKFTVDNDLTKVIEFKAVSNREGGASGSMIFSGPAVIPKQDVDGDGNTDFSGKLASLDMDVSFDNLVVEKNLAVMSGTVTNCNVREYIGRRVLLTVEDNGDGTDPKSPDKFTWGFYRKLDIWWTPADAELREDPGVGLRWWATDYERKDDVGYAMPKQNDPVGIQTFPSSSYALEDIITGNGNINVYP